MKDGTSAATPGLGNLIKEYPMSTARIREILFLMLVSAGMSLGCFLPAIFTTDTSPSWMRERIAIILLGLFMATPAIVAVWRLLVMRASSLSLYENGLIYRAHGQATSTRWDEIDSYIQESACRIAKKDGRVIEFGANILDFDDAAEKIRVQTDRHLLPAMKSVLRKGGSLQFKGLKPFPDRFLGKWLNRFSYATSGLQIDEQGIRALDGGDFIAWKDVTEYGLSQAPMGRWPVSVISIQSRSTRLQTRAALLGNSHLLLTLCAALTKAQDAEQDTT